MCDSARLIPATLTRVRIAAGVFVDVLQDYIFHRLYNFEIDHKAKVSLAFLRFDCATDLNARAHIGAGQL